MPGRDLRAEEETTPVDSPSPLVLEFRAELDTRIRALSDEIGRRDAHIMTAIVRIEEKLDVLVARNRLQTIEQAQERLAFRKELDALKARVRTAAEEAAEARQRAETTGKSLQAIGEATAVELVRDRIQSHHEIEVEKRDDKRYTKRWIMGILGAVLAAALSWFKWWYK